MAWLFIVIGLISAAGGVWMAGDERVACHAAASNPPRGTAPAADCRIQIRRWWGTQIYRDSAAPGIEGFRTFEDRQKASDPNEATQLIYSFEMAAHDGSRYRVVANREDADAAVGKARQWLLNGMHGEYVFVSDAFGRGTFACLIGAGCFLGGLVGLVSAPGKR